MAYFNFNYITDPPNDELVEEQSQLNANWDVVEEGLKPFNQNPPDFTGITIPKGTVSVNPLNTNNIAAWDGTTWNGPVNPINIWENWQLVNIRAPVIHRPGHELKARIDIASRRIVLMGGVQLNATADAWDTATSYEITTDTAIQDSLAPANADFTSIQQGGASQITAAGGFASSVIWIEKRATPSRTAISVRWQGDAGGGNFIMLDGVQWWY